MSLVPIDRADDARVADYRGLTDAALLRERGLFVAEGRLVVSRVLELGRFPVRSLLLTEVALASLREVVDPVLDRVPVHVASKAILREVTGFHFHQGCLGLAERPAEPLPSALLESARRVVVLEGVSHADNVGSVFRNGAAFGADAVLLGAGCADPLYREAIRVSMGAALRVPFARVDDWPEGLGELRAAGFALVALTPSADAVPIRELSTRLAAGAIANKIALLIGSEGEGLSAAALALAELRARIPMAPGIDSLNLAAATAIALHELFTAR